MKTKRIGAELLAIALGGLTVACDSAKPTASAVPSGTAVLASAPRAAAVTGEWVEEIFIDYAGKPSHAGPGPHPTTESDAFRLVQGGIRWPSGVDVEYQIVSTEALSGGNTAVQAALATWDGFILTRDFVHNEETGQTNPCTGNPSRFEWPGIDGPGGVLAIARVCRNVVTKEIVGFVVSFDVTDTWSTSGEAGKFDLENAASHEWGHVAGLGHVNAPKDGCLAMYTFAAPEETQKRTLGLGDKRGMQTLYESTDVTAGTCGS